MLNKKTKCIWLSAFVLIVTFSAFSMMTPVTAHSPKFVDVKFYLPEQVLSVYITHGVSDTSYHYIETVQIQFFNLSTEFFTYVDGLIDAGEMENRSFIQEHHVKEEFLTEYIAFNITYTEQESEEHEHQIFHHNYIMSDYFGEVGFPFIIEHYTYIRVTAYSGCADPEVDLGGQFTKNELAGQIWYDIEHSMIEALVPTLVCAVVVLTPLVIWAIIGKRREKREALMEVASK